MVCIVLAATLKGPQICFFVKLSLKLRTLKPEQTPVVLQ